MAHSRIPIFHGTERRWIQGLLLTKMLIQYSSSEVVPVGTLIQNNKCYRPLQYVNETTPLYDLLQLFKSGKSDYYLVDCFIIYSLIRAAGHMAVVVKDNIDEEQSDAIKRFSTIGEDQEASNLVSVFPPVSIYIVRCDELS